jgi:hypothetical protein
MVLGCLEAFLEGGGTNFPIKVKGRVLPFGIMVDYNIPVCPTM